MYTIARGPAQTLIYILGRLPEKLGYNARQRKERKASQIGLYVDPEDIPFVSSSLAVVGVAFPNFPCA